MNIVILGGGTGSHGVLVGLKQTKTLELTAIVNMTDDGGSNQIIRDEFGILPLSDLRKSIIALSRDNRNDILRKLFTYRFDKGVGLSGHTLGNLIMTALTEITGNESDAVDVACDIFDVQGKVIPVTLDQVRLVAEYDDGSSVLGEHHIDEPGKNHTGELIKRLYSIPVAKANPKAVDAIETADFIIIGPGDLYTTTIANLIIDGIPQALQRTSAKVIYISNLMSKKGQTRGMTANDHINEIEKYATRRPDISLINNGPLPPEGLQRYIAIGEHVIVDDLSPNDPSIFRTDIVAHEFVQKSSGDTLIRSYVRHDPQKMKHALELLFKNS